jgi:ribosomal protein L37E
MEDNKGKVCTLCGEGTFEETRLYDDWRGKLHCTVCGLEVNRQTKEPNDGNQDLHTNFFG